jgi:hypothetical protein
MGGKRERERERREQVQRARDDRERERSQDCCFNEEEKKRTYVLNNQHQQNLFHKYNILLHLDQYRFHVYYTNLNI